MSTKKKINRVLNENVENSSFMTTDLSLDLTQQEAFKDLVELFFHKDRFGFLPWSTNRPDARKTNPVTGDFSKTFSPGEYSIDIASPFGGQTSDNYVPLKRIKAMHDREDYSSATREDIVKFGDIVLKYSDDLKKNQSFRMELLTAMKYMLLTLQEPKK